MVFLCWLNLVRHIVFRICFLLLFRSRYYLTHVLLFKCSFILRIIIWVLIHHLLVLCHYLFILLFFLFINWLYDWKSSLLHCEWRLHWPWLQSHHSNQPLVPVSACHRMWQMVLVYLISESSWSYSKDTAITCYFCTMVYRNYTLCSTPRLPSLSSTCMSNPLHIHISCTSCSSTTTFYFKPHLVQVLRAILPYWVMLREVFFHCWWTLVLPSNFKLWYLLPMLLELFLKSLFSITLRLQLVAYPDLCHHRHDLYY